MVQNDLERKIDYCTKYYGLDWERVPAGILVSNGVEYWLLKMKKDRVRKMLHQNHGRNGNTVALPCEKRELNNEFVQKFFHSQNWKEGDLKKTCFYMANHGKARSIIMAKQRAVLAALT